MNMKSIRCFLLAFLLVPVCIRAAELPRNPETLRILAVGNSFSNDATTWLPDLLEGAGIHNVILARLYIGGCSLERHCREYEKMDRNYKYYKSTENSWVTVSEKATILDGIGDEPWDIITIQQSSPLSGVPESFDPWTERLIGIIRKHCSNPDVVIVWHQTWAYARSSTHRAFPTYGNNQMIMYGKINECTDELSRRFDFATVIPSGTAVQNARWSHIIFDGKDLTRDGFHLNTGYTRYLAACVWFESLIRPALGKSVVGNPFRMQETDKEIDARTARRFQRIAARTVKSNRWK